MLQMTGRRMVFWGALALLAWAGYELAIRFEEAVTWLTPVYSLVADGKISLMDYLSRVPWARLRTHLFLLVCLLFALYALLARRGLISALIALPIAVLLALFSLGSTPLMGASLWQKLKLIPLVLIALGSGLVFVGALGKKKQKGGGISAPPRRQPYNPFGIRKDE
ncbi:MAG: hypothetical protein GXY84_01635 [Clostridiales bacterium]|nr:hypothetical protein [Clostridiales bacterium]